MAYSVNPGGASNEYGLQRIQIDSGRTKANRESAEAADRKLREDYEAAQAKAAKAAVERAKEHLRSDIEAVADRLAGGWSPYGAPVEALSWGASPIGKEGAPRVERVTLKGLGPMTVEEIVCRGILFASGLNHTAYLWAVERYTAQLNGSP